VPTCGAPRSVAWRVSLSACHRHVGLATQKLRLPFLNELRASRVAATACDNGRTQGSAGSSVDPARTPPVPYIKPVSNQRISPNRTYPKNHNHGLKPESWENHGRHRLFALACYSSNRLGAAEVGVATIGVGVYHSVSNCLPESRVRLGPHLVMDRCLRIASLSGAPPCAFVPSFPSKWNRSCLGRVSIWPGWENAGEVRRLGRVRVARWSWGRRRLWRRSIRFGGLRLGGARTPSRGLSQPWVCDRSARGSQDISECGSSVFYLSASIEYRFGWV
jgi:hypothetical protein